ncbi:MAG: hypothetical protein NTW19_21045 [Planctomycetota bacterium]|nr:hypothetical protein [Planctomycetota bacterium]
MTTSLAPASVASTSTKPRIRALKLKDGHFPRRQAIDATYGSWDYDDFLKPANRKWRDAWISFDCLLADLERDIVWCGIATFTSDVLWAYERSTGKFRSMGYAKVGNKFDAKFHRSLLHDNEGQVLAATALYHDPDRFLEAPGGALVSFDPQREKLRVIDRPLPHLYIQSIEIDRERNVLYGQTAYPEYFFSYDLATGKCTTLGTISGGQGLSQAETLVVDPHGTVWGCYGVCRAWANAVGSVGARLWSYHPDDKAPVYHRHGLPSLDGKGFAKPDGVHLGPDGAVYMGSAEGALYRINSKNAKVEFIGKPAPGARLTGMVNGHDGKLYGSCGRLGAANLFSLEPGSGKLTNLGPIFDPALEEQMYQCHNMCITPDGTIYGGENDVPWRSSYLWEIAGVCPSREAVAATQSNGKAVKTTKSAKGAKR